ncbi:MAG TPA: hypothetical protein VLF43_00755 [Candidatus Saccharimonadales bacterium]|nr:hypothetical protein [Candidatus Saccharimonadales bacterium]
MKPSGKNGITFESLGELVVLYNGLGALAIELANTSYKGSIEKFCNFVGKIVIATKQVLSNPELEKRVADGTPITVDDPFLAQLARDAVDLVANNPPDTTGYPQLQDPLQHDLAVTMWREYHELK